MGIDRHPENGRGAHQVLRLRRGGAAPVQMARAPPLDPHLHRAHHQRREAPPLPRPVRSLSPPQTLKFNVEIV